MNNYKVYILIREHEHEDMNIMTDTDIVNVYADKEKALEKAKELADETHDYLLEYPGENTIEKTYISEIEEGFGEGFETGLRYIGYPSFKDGSVEYIFYKDENDYLIIEHWRYSVEEWEVQNE